MRKNERRLSEPLWSITGSTVLLLARRNRSTILLWLTQYSSLSHHFSLSKERMYSYVCVCDTLYASSCKLFHLLSFLPSSVSFSSVKECARQFGDRGRSSVCSAAASTEQLSLLFQVHSVYLEGSCRVACTVISVLRYGSPFQKHLTSSQHFRLTTSKRLLICRVNLHNGVDIIQWQGVTLHLRKHQKRLGWDAY